MNAQMLALTTTAPAPPSPTTTTATVAAATLSLEQLKQRLRRLGLPRTQNTYPHSALSDVAYFSMQFMLGEAPP